jgi:endonuclease VIII
VPEGDTIHRLATQLRERLAGQPVRQVEVHGRSQSGVRPPPAGTVIESVDAHGKHLLIRFADGATLRTHLQMNGRWDWYPTGQPWRRSRHRMRARIAVDAGEAVCFDAPLVVLERVSGVGHLGPDLCQPDADLDECVRRMAALADPATLVGDVLLDQRIACGVGNVYKSEVCFACQVDPRAPIGTVPDEIRHRLVATAATMLQTNLGPGPRTTVAGRPGSLAVYGRARRPCRRCGTAILVARTGIHGRSTYWCPSCQADANGVEHRPE